MRVAYILADLGIPLPGTKGASVHAQAIIRAIGELGHEVVCYACRAEEQDGRKGQASVRAVGLDPILAGLVESLSRSARTPERRALRRRELSGLCLNDPFRKAVEDDHLRRPFDLLLERYSLWSLAGARLSRDLSVPLLLEVNAPLPEEERRFRSLALAPVARAVRRLAFREASGIVAVSREMAEGAVRQGADPSRVVIVPNGFEPALFRPAAAPRPRRDGFTIGFLGSLKPWHGIEALCRAFALLARDDPGTRLLLVGDGPLHAWVDAFAARAHLRDRIELTGRMAHERVPGQLRRFDVAVAPYADGDGFYFSPLKLFEYMASGLPIVASRIGQIAEVLAHGRTALLVPPGDPPALARAVRRLRRSEALRRSLGRAAARTAHENYRWRDAALKVMRLAERVLQERIVCHGA